MTGSRVVFARGWGKEEGFLENGRWELFEVWERSIS